MIGLQLILLLIISDQCSYLFKQFQSPMISNLKQTFSDLLKQAKQTNEHSIKTTTTTQSYQQASYHIVQNKNKQLLDNLNKLQPTIKSRILNKVVKDNKYFSASIMSEAEKIRQLVEDLSGLGMGINISHRQKYSESVMLAVYFKCQGSKTVVMTTQGNQRSWQKLLVGSQDPNPQGFIDSQLQKEQIKIVTLQNNCQMPQNYDLVILDLFNSSQYFYKPILLGKMSQLLQKNKKFILYSANYQEQNIMKLLTLQNISEKLLDIPINTMQPFETIEENDPLKYLINFLIQEQNHPNKQDCIIFYKKPKEQSLNQFIHYLNKYVHQSTLSLKNLNIITKSNQEISKEKNTIFVVQGSQQLNSWRYNLNEVFLVIDFGYQENYYFDYEMMCYANEISISNPIETSKRMNYVGINKIGRYLYKKQAQDSLQYPIKTQLQKQADISKYCCLMFASNNDKFLQKDNERVIKCLKILKNMKILIQKEGKLIISNPELLKYPISPIFAQLILGTLSNKRLANLLIMMLVCMENSGNLKQQKKDIIVHKATKIPPIWRQSGYLHSVLDILTKSQLIQHGAHKDKLSSKKSKTMVKKQTSAPQEESLFGNLYQIVQPKKLTFDQMEIGDFIVQCFINQQILMQIEERIDTLRDEFQLDRQDIYLQHSDVEKVIEKYVVLHEKGVGIYSGSRRVGYLVNGMNEGLFPHKTSLMSILNEKPTYLYIFRIKINNNKKQIQMSNSLNEQCYTSCVGKLPIKQKKSYSESQIQFHGISTATIKQLQDKFKSQLQSLQQKYQCLIEPNEQMSMIIIYTHKKNQVAVKEIFESILNKIRQKISRNTKIAPYLGGTKVILGSGGNITEIIKENYINKCQVSNLPAFCTAQDLHDLFDEFFVLKNIEMVQDDNKFKSSAIVEFFSQKDFYLFHKYFNQCLYGDRYIYVKPITMNIEESFQRSMYLKFQWNVWKSHNKAIIQYNDQNSTEEAYKNLHQNPIFDGQKIKIKRQSPTKIILQDIKSITDEIFIEKDLKKFGTIKMVQVLRTPIKQSLKQQQILDYHIKNCFAQNIKYRIEPIQKKKNGLRIAHVYFKEEANMKTVFQRFDTQEGIIGVGRVYLTQRYLYPIVIPPTMTNLYQQLLQEVISSLPQDFLNLIKHSIQIGKDEKTYLLLKAKRKDVGDTLNTKFINSLKGYAMQLTDLQKNVVLNEIGMDNIMDLQQKYPCKLIPNFLKKTLDIIAPFNLVKKIKQEILFKIQQSFFYRVPLNEKSFKYFKAHPEKYQCLVNTYHLKFADLEEMSKSILLDGSAIHVQNSFSYLMHIIQSLMVPEEQMKNADVCQICYEQFHRPYRLQKCGHKFCASCIIQNINMALGDISLFPVRCPQCLTEVAIDDLEFLIGQDQWGRIINIAMNQYIGKHPDHYTYCFNAGCKQVNAINLNYFSCDLCNSSFCLQCKLNYHPGMSCEQAKKGGDTAFKKFMQENNIRKCPYQKCGMPIQRSDGCYRVTCLRCGKSMCFKCQPDKMIAYDHYNDCYKHLSDVHGGYW